ncbi:DUF423 domain-containing protein [Flavobacterium sp. NRK F10]|uniref:DUF423 domain-containing protein n=1 Tax=Flavobacterium sediminis TaxID=2201181 RepID=A0A2U8QVL7_9FLAO|nr:MULTISPECIES: DUF423 domain-containing protein [Flavobacterium]AWM13835.1 DUF423 domain-containing protein [Flavobacterium sediminis]MCO6175003.1 DUF423 domain-containing protein [Flavobacterium sp. NRK F10]
MEKKILGFAIVIGLLAIVLGALGAHGLKKFLSLEQLASFETGVRYQMYHALFLLFVSQFQNLAVSDKVIVFYLAAIGVVFFSGSIYVLSTSSMTGIKAKFLGPVTPLGGVLMIASWGYLLYATLLKNGN